MEPDEGDVETGAEASEGSLDTPEVEHGGMDDVREINRVSDFSF